MAAEKRSRRTALRWLKRGAIVLTALVLAAGLAFELWRQASISSADRNLEAAIAEISAELGDSPTFEQWRADLRQGSNGDRRFLDGLMAALGAFTIEDSDNPAEALPWHGWGENPHQTPESAALADWLRHTQPLADAVEGLRQFDHITLDPADIAFDGDFDRRVSTLVLFALGSVRIPADRVAAHVHLGQPQQARNEFLALCELVGHLQDPASPVQRMLLAVFTAHAQELQWRLAADNILAAEDYVTTKHIHAEWQLQTATACKGMLMRMRDGGPGVLLLPPEDYGDSRAWFAWLNPARLWEDGAEGFFDLALLYSYRRNTTADWVRYSLKWIKAARNADPVPEPPEYIGFLPNIVHWDEHAPQIHDSPALREWQTLVVAIRERQIAGDDAASIAQALPSARFVEVERAGEEFTLRYAHSEDTWEHLRPGKYDSLPDTEEFYKHFPPLTLSLD